jgi:cytochrome P450
MLSFSGVTDGPIYDLINALMLSTDGPDHRRIRGVVSSFFTHAGVERYRAAVTADATALAAALPDDQPFDLWDQFALPLAGRAACGTIGVPTPDVPTVTGWALDVVRAFAVMSPEVKERVEHAAVQLCAYLDDLLAGRQNAQGNDVISAIMSSTDMTYEESVPWLPSSSSPVLTPRRTRSRPAPSICSNAVCGPSWPTPRIW